jgi:glutathione S-transferase
MKLYYAPGTCALSPHIVLHEAGLPFEGKLTNIRSHQLADGADFYAVNPKGSVPVLEFDNGERLTEGPAIVQWIADQVPDKQLAPAAGSMPRYRLAEWLNFISTEIHKAYSPLFNPAMPQEGKQVFIDKLLERYQFVDDKLAGKDYLMGSQFSVADAYLYTVTRWATPMKIDLSKFTHLAAFMQRMEGRPAVQKALQEQGLK